MKLHLACGPFLGVWPMLVAAGPALAEPASPPTLHAALGAPDDLKISATIRLRYEAIDGQARTGANPSDQLISLRSTLFAEYDAGPFRIAGEIRDSRAYLDNRGTPLTTGEVNTVEPAQAYIATDIKLPHGKLTLQGGRMTMAIASSRLVANDDFRNTANGFTGLRADYAGKNGTAVTAFWVLPQARLPDDRASLDDNRFALDREGLDLVLWGGFATTPPKLAGSAVTLGYVRLREHDRAGAATRRRDLHSIDLRWNRAPHPGKVDWDVEGIRQFGSIATSTAANAPRVPVDASFYRVALGYSVPGRLGLRFQATYDEATGDGPGRTYNRFDTLFGLRRADFSPGGIYGELSRNNIRAAGGRVEVTPNKRLDALFDTRGLWLSSRYDSFASTGVRDARGRSGDYAGTQLDARVRYWIVPKLLRGEINLDYLAKGRFLDTAPNAPRDGDTKFGAFALTAYF